MTLLNAKFHSSKTKYKQERVEVEVVGSLWLQQQINFLKALKSANIIPATVINSQGRGFEPHPGQSFSLPLCGPIFLTRDNA